MIPIPELIATRALSRVAMGPNGCHLSRYPTDTGGYAQLTARRRKLGTRQTYLAHRAAWTAVHGPIPDGMTVDHVCRVRRCVRIDHLRLLPMHENARRNHGQNYPLGQSCRRGHDPSERVAVPGRACTTCLGCRRETRTR